MADQLGINLGGIVALEDLLYLFDQTEAFSLGDEALATGLVPIYEFTLRHHVPRIPCLLSVMNYQAILEEVSIDVLWLILVVRKLCDLFTMYISLAFQHTVVKSFSFLGHDERIEIEVVEALFAQPLPNFWNISFVLVRGDPHIQRQQVHVVAHRLEFVNRCQSKVLRASKVDWVAKVAYSLLFNYTTSDSAECVWSRDLRLMASFKGVLVGRQSWALELVLRTQRVL